MEKSEHTTGLPEPGEAIFYPKVGHCVYRGLTEDRAAPGTKLVELEDLEEGSRILIPMARVPGLGLRPAGKAFEEIRAELSADFEEPLPSEEELEPLIERLITEGSPRSLAKGLKRLHLRRQTKGLSREEEQTRRRIRSWLAAEVSLSKECTRAEAQALITRILQEAMAAHRRREREVAKERRRQVKAQQKEVEPPELDDPSALGAPLDERSVEDDTSATATGEGLAGGDASAEKPLSGPESASSIVDSEHSAGEPATTEDSETTSQEDLATRRESGRSAPDELGPREASLSDASSEAQSSSSPSVEERPPMDRSPQAGPQGPAPEKASPGQEEEAETRIRPSSPLTDREANDEEPDAESEDPPSSSS